MTDSPSFPRTVRRQLHDAILDAAREQTAAHGWDSVRMADVAASVGVSRQTIYNEFGNRAGVAEALVQRELERFLAGIAARLNAHGGDIRATVHTTVAYVLTEAAGNPLIKSVLTSARGGDSLLPYLTTHPEIVLAGVTELLRGWAGSRLAGLSEIEIRRGCESIARLVVSHIVFPTDPPEDTAAVVADMTVRFIEASPRTHR